MELFSLGITWQGDVGVSQKGFVKKPPKFKKHYNYN